MRCFNIETFHKNILAIAITSAISSLIQSSYATIETENSNSTSKINTQVQKSPLTQPDTSDINRINEEFTQQHWPPEKTKTINASHIETIPELITITPTNKGDSIQNIQLSAAIEAQGGTALNNGSIEVNVPATGIKATADLQETDSQTTVTNNGMILLNHPESTGMVSNGASIEWFGTGKDWDEHSNHYKAGAINDTHGAIKGQGTRMLSYSSGLIKNHGNIQISGSHSTGARAQSNDPDNADVGAGLMANTGTITAIRGSGPFNIAILTPGSYIKGKHAAVLLEGSDNDMNLIELRGGTLQGNLIGNSPMDILRSNPADNLTGEVNQKISVNGEIRDFELIYIAGDKWAAFRPAINPKSLIAGGTVNFTLSDISEDQEQTLQLSFTDKFPEANGFDIKVNEAGITNIDLSDTNNRPAARISLEGGNMSQMTGHLKDNDELSLENGMINIIEDVHRIRAQTDGDWQVKTPVRGVKHLVTEVGGDSDRPALEQTSIILRDSVFSPEDHSSKDRPATKANTLVVATPSESEIKTGQPIPEFDGSEGKAEVTIANGARFGQLVSPEKLTVTASAEQPFHAYGPVRDAKHIEVSPSAHVQGLTLGTAPPNLDSNLGFLFSEIQPGEPIRIINNGTITTIDASHGNQRPALNYIHNSDTPVDLRGSKGRNDELTLKGGSPETVQAVTSSALQNGFSSLNLDGVAAPVELPADLESLTLTSTLPIGHVYADLEKERVNKAHETPDPTFMPFSSGMPEKTILKTDVVTPGLNFSIKERPNMRFEVLDGEIGSLTGNPERDDQLVMGLLEVHDQASLGDLSLQGGVVHIMPNDNETLELGRIINADGVYAPETEFGYVLVGNNPQLCPLGKNLVLGTPEHDWHNRGLVNNPERLTIAPDGSTDLIIADGALPSEQDVNRRQALHLYFSDDSPYDQKKAFVVTNLGETGADEFLDNRGELNVLDFSADTQRPSLYFIQHGGNTGEVKGRQDKQDTLALINGRLKKASGFANIDIFGSDWNSVQLTNPKNINIHEGAGAANILFSGMAPEGKGVLATDFTDDHDRVHVNSKGTLGEINLLPDHSRPAFTIEQTGGTIGSIKGANGKNDHFIATNTKVTEQLSDIDNVTFNGTNSYEGNLLQSNGLVGVNGNLHFMADRTAIVSGSPGSREAEQSESSPTFHIHQGATVTIPSELNVNGSYQHDGRLVLTEYDPDSARLQPLVDGATQQVPVVSANNIGVGSAADFVFDSSIIKDPAIGKQYLLMEATESNINRPVNVDAENELYVHYDAIVDPNNTKRMLLTSTNQADHRANQVPRRFRSMMLAATKPADKEEAVHPKADSNSAKLTRHVVKNVKVGKDSAKAAELAPAMSPHAVHNANLALKTAGKTLDDRVSGKRTGISTGDIFSAGRAWIQYSYSKATQDLKDNVPGYHAKTNGFSIGTDNPLEEDQDIEVGIAYTYAKGKVEGKDGSRNKIDTNTHIFSLYSSYIEDDFFFDGRMSYSFGKNKGHRYVGGNLHDAKYDTQGWGVGMIAGYTYPLGYKWSWQPQVAFNYYTIKTDDYTESARDPDQTFLSYDQVNNGKYDIMELGAGLKLIGEINTDSMIIKPELGLMGFHDFKKDQIAITAHFAAGGQNFLINGADNRYLFDTSIYMEVQSNTTITFSYSHHWADSFKVAGVIARIRSDF